MTTVSPSRMNGLIDLPFGLKETLILFPRMSAATFARTVLLRASAIPYGTKFPPCRSTAAFNCFSEVLSEPQRALGPKADVNRFVLQHIH